jgi:hypothetical protein
MVYLITNALCNLFQIFFAVYRHIFSNRVLYVRPNHCSTHYRPVPTTCSPTNPYWARVVGYGPLCVSIRKMCPRSGDINRLMILTVRRMILRSGLKKTIYLVLIDQQSVGKRSLHLMDTVNAKKRWTTIYWRVNKLLKKSHVVTGPA